MALCTQAANYLNIKSLLDLTCLTVANMIKGALGCQPSLLLCFETAGLCGASVTTGLLRYE